MPAGRQAGRQEGRQAGSRADVQAGGQAGRREGREGGREGRKEGRHDLGNGNGAHCQRGMVSTGLWCSHSGSWMREAAIGARLHDRRVTAGPPPSRLRPASVPLPSRFRTAHVPLPCGSCTTPFLGRRGSGMLSDRPPPPCHNSTVLGDRFTPHSARTTLPAAPALIRSRDRTRRSNRPHPSFSGLANPQSE